MFEQNFIDSSKAFIFENIWLNFYDFNKIFIFKYNITVHVREGGGQETQLFNFKKLDAMD